MLTLFFSCRNFKILPSIIYLVFDCTNNNSCYSYCLLWIQKFDQLQPFTPKGALLKHWKKNI
ncbi:hypothetical protein BpHYR1_040379 [Brachionus plicatilis]|uniref:Uncharacterized protein n=1 Tax=Brachionus plicatilis TaxID=10195 RepID=A0A3M7QY28_BRAPC|nr:hypothetical protein BpHYR1_040379 [Brachionus plicatilis]